MNNEPPSDDLQAHLINACKSILANYGYFDTENEFEKALCNRFGEKNCARQVYVERFDEATFPPPEPPDGLLSIDVCAKKGARKLDVLWRLERFNVALELKYQRCVEWEGTFKGHAVFRPGWADSLGYLFLKDIHRLERLRSVLVEGRAVVPDRRFCIFLANEPKNFHDQSVHDAISLRNRTISAPHRVQYNLTKPNGQPTSLNTLWRDYPPFYLANSYDLNWIDLKDDVSAFVPSEGGGVEYPACHLLLIEVKAQRAPPPRNYGDKLR